LKQKLEKEVPEAMITPLGPPPVSGLGSTGGFKFIVEDRGDNGLRDLEAQTYRLIGSGNGGHFMLTDRSFAALRGADAGLVPEPALTKLAELKDKDFLTKESFAGAVDAALAAGGVPAGPDRAKGQKRVLDSAENHKVVTKLFTV